VTSFDPRSRRVIAGPLGASGAYLQKWNRRDDPLVRGGQLLADPACSAYGSFLAHSAVMLPKAPYREFLSRRKTVRRRSRFSVSSHGSDVNPELFRSEPAAEKSARPRLHGGEN
jgi:hypothetical protein